jgi:uncharacterized protein YprB with RNaseH-like and TPR domain
MGTTAPKTALLEELRARTRQILERASNLGPRPLPAVDTDDLPFAECETPSGPLHVRARRLSPAHRIGHVSVAGGRHASPELLALLALDPALAVCDVERALYLDVEIAKTAAGARTVAFLVGLAWWDEKTIVLEQLLVRGLAEEPAMLGRLRERLEAASMVVTFNGKTFDAPLLRERFAVLGMHGLPWPPHLDLLHVARRVHGSRAGRGCRLVTVEQDTLGFGREADVPSGRVSACYMHFLRTGEAGALLAVTDHNAWDVVAMVALVGLYGDPLHGALTANDLVGVARTLRRAGALDRAAAVADLAFERGSARSPENGAAHRRGSACSPENGAAHRRGSASVTHEGATLEALRVRADVAKARGNWSRAADDLESLAGSMQNSCLALELAKLYEHRMRIPARALEWARRGTGEPPERLAERVSRLQRKIARAARSARVAGPAPGAGRKKKGK